MLRLKAQYAPLSLTKKTLPTNLSIPSSNQNTETSKPPQTLIKPIEFSTFTLMRNSLLSTFVPVNLAIAFHEKFSGTTSEQGVFKKFSVELQHSLNITGCSPEFITNLIPEYLTTILRNKMYTGELLAFQNRLEHDLTYAYDNTLPESTRNLYKIRAFKTMMLQLGPHGLKHIQSMRPKDPNSWISEAILTAQSDLPAVPIQKIEEMLKEAFRARGTLKYVNNFSQHFEVEKVLGAGTVGIAALLKFKETPTANEKELVIKLIRPNTIENFQIDNDYLNQAIDILLSQNKATPLEASSFKQISGIKLEEELKEANPNLENAYLLEEPYQGPGVTTVKGNIELAGKASNVVFMEKAQGIELGKYLKKIRKALANPELSEEEREIHLQQLATLRKKYCQLARIHLNRVATNKSVHADLHSGNVFYDPETECLSVLDLGAVARPVSPVEHLKMRRFLFYIYLSAGTADSEYLRMYYMNYNNMNDTIKKVDENKIEELLKQVQKKLDQIKKKSIHKNVIDTEKTTAEIISIISNTALMNGPEMVPSALVNLSRSNSLIAEELEALSQDLAGTQYASQIPYSERTQLALALKAAWNQGRANNAELWTKDTWDYFVKNALKTGMKQLQFEKKFIYGIFGFSESDAAAADLLIPTAVISTPIVLYLSTKTLYHAAKNVASKLPDFALTYRFMQAYKNMQGVSKQDMFNKFNSMLTNNKFFQSKLANPTREMKISMQNKFNSGINSLKNTFNRPHFFTNPAFKKYAAGLVIGGAAVYGAKKLYDKHNKPRS